MKKLICIALSAVMLLAIIPLSAVTSFAATKDGATLGDINGDGEIDQFDYILAMRIYFKTYSPDDAELVRGDVNGDGVNDQFDYILIKRHYFKTYVIGSTPERKLWTRDDAYYFGSYASDALDSLTSAISYSNAAMKNGIYMSYSYYSAIQSSVKQARIYLEKLKSYADTRAELEFTEDSKHANLCELIDETIAMCRDFEEIEYYSNMLSAEPTIDLININTNMRSINQIAIQLMEAFL